MTETCPLVCSISSSLSLIPVRMCVAALANLSGTPLLCWRASEGESMSLVRLLGFRTLTCGCVIGRYRELATSREVSYVEEKGTQCELHGHRRNHTIPE